MKVKNRVKSHEDFQKVIHENKSVANRNFVVYYMKNELGYSRVGISVSKKVGNAVVRSTTRRQVRAMAHTVINFEAGFDYCIIVRKNYLTNSFEVNQNELSILIKKVK